LLSSQVECAACATNEARPVQEDACAVYHPSIRLRLVAKDSAPVGLFMKLKELGLEITGQHCCRSWLIIYELRSD
jgi:hypothetical protein